MHASRSSSGFSSLCSGALVIGFCGPFKPMLQGCRPGLTQFLDINSTRRANEMRALDLP
jgi:hypothetical protein